MYMVDTNVWIERLLEQKSSDIEIRPDDRTTRERIRRLTLGRSRDVERIPPSAGRHP